MIATKERIDCTHCGEACSEESSLHHQGATFCCQSRHAVHELLPESGPGYDEAVGVSSAAAVERYAHLDREELQKELLDFETDKCHKDAI